MSYDITFCSNTKCKIKKCERNPERLKNWIYPVSMADFKECKYFKSKKGEEKWIKKNY